MKRHCSYMGRDCPTLPECPEAECEALVAFPIGGELEVVVVDGGTPAPQCLMTAPPEAPPYRLSVSSDELRQRARESWPITKENFHRAWSLAKNHGVPPKSDPGGTELQYDKDAFEHVQNWLERRAARDKRGEQ